MTQLKTLCFILICLSLFKTKCVLSYESTCTDSFSERDGCELLQPAVFEDGVVKKHYLTTGKRTKLTCVIKQKSGNRDNLEILMQKNNGQNTVICDLDNVHFDYNTKFNANKKGNNTIELVFLEDESSYLTNDYTFSCLTTDGWDKKETKAQFSKIVKIKQLSLQKQELWKGGAGFTDIEGNKLNIQLTTKELEQSLTLQLKCATELRGPTTPNGPRMPKIGEGRFPYKWEKKSQGDNQEWMDVVTTGNGILTITDILDMYNKGEKKEYRCIAEIRGFDSKTKLVTISVSKEFNLAKAATSSLAIIIYIVIVAILICICCFFRNKKKNTRDDSSSSSSSFESNKPIDHPQRLPLEHNPGMFNQQMALGWNDTDSKFTGSNFSMMTGAPGQPQPNPNMMPQYNPNMMQQLNPNMMQQPNPNMMQPHQNMVNSNQNFMTPTNNMMMKDNNNDKNKKIDIEELDLTLDDSHF